jgi:hypothetical protein
MYEGLWIVQYAGMEGKDAGIVVLTGGRALGGDNAFTYIGTYTEAGGGIRASVAVQNFNPQIGNVLGIKGDFRLELRAVQTASGVLEGEGSTPQAPGFGLKVKLTRKAALP